MEWIVIFILIFVVIRLSSKLSHIEEEIKSLRTLFAPGEKKYNAPDVVKPTVSYHKDDYDPKKSSAKTDDENIQEVAKIVLPGARKKAREGIDQNLEFKFGSKIVTGIGVVALLFGVGFFLRFAFEQNLINEETRIILGFILGFVLLGFGEYTRLKKYESYSQIVTGGGLGMLYLCLYASYNYYHFISQPIAFIGMILVTALGVFLAARYNSVYLACFTQAGGFLTPFLLPSATSNYHGLFIYILLLDIGMCLIAVKQFWRVLIYGSFGGSAIIYLLWFTTSNGLSIFFFPFFYATLLFAIFLILPLFQFIIKNKAVATDDIALFTINPALYYFLSYTILQQRYPEWTGFFTAVLAGVYLLLSYLVRRYAQEENSIVSDLFLWISLVLMVLVVPIQFEKSLVTIAWAAEAAVFSFIGIKRNSRFIQILSFLLFEAVAIRLIAFESAIYAKDLMILNGRMLTYLLSIGFFGVGAYFFNKLKDKSEEVRTIYSILSLNIYGLVLWLTSIEIQDFFDNKWLPITWSAIALAVGIFGLYLKNTALRLATHFVYVFIAIWILLFHSYVSLTTYIPIFNFRMLIYGITIASAGFFAYSLGKFKDDIREDEYSLLLPLYKVALHGLSLYIISREVLDFINKQNRAGLTPPLQNIYQYQENLKRASLSVTWLLYAVGLLVWGIINKSLINRVLALSLLSIVILKVFMYDTLGLTNFYRFISYIALGAILLLAGYLYNRFKTRITEFIIVGEK